MKVRQGSSPADPGNKADPLENHPHLNRAPPLQRACTHTHTRASTHSHMCRCRHTHTRAGAHTHVQAHTCAGAHTHVQAHTLTFVQAHTCAGTHTHTRAGAHRRAGGSHSASLERMTDSGYSGAHQHFSQLLLSSRKLFCSRPFLLPAIVASIVSVTEDNCIGNDSDI